ncbi:MAG: hypothetical protein K0R90_624 [Oscillospiraceae bacterium]|jgi:hypothetical protein|nr:hypothetical protein [Oscillospiraceae bacterium]
MNIKYKKNSWKPLTAIIIFAVLLVTFTTTAFAQSLPDGYVTIGFVDNGVRLQDELNEGSVDFPTKLGEIIAPTKVPFYDGENIASVTLRLLDMKSIEYAYTGSPDSSFYLSCIQNFKVGQKSIATFGEFDAGSGSGWMVTLNNWFINMSASEFPVEDGDIIRWQYTCQLGADIGCDWSNQSAKITNVLIDSKYGTISPKFDSSIKNYTLTVPSNVSSVKMEALQENYWAKVTYRVGNTHYKLLRDIPVSNGTQIIIDSAFAEYAGGAPTDTDKITIAVSKKSSSSTSAGGDSSRGSTSNASALGANQSNNNIHGETSTSSDKHRNTGSNGITSNEQGLTSNIVQSDGSLSGGSSNMEGVGSNLIESQSDFIQASKQVGDMKTSTKEISANNNAVFIFILAVVIALVISAAIIFYLKYYRPRHKE